MFGFGTRTLTRLAHPALALVLAGAIGVLTLASCSDSNKNPANPGGGTPGTSTFIGMFTSNARSGKLTVNIATTSLAGGWGGHRAARAAVGATGTAVIGGTSYPLTGGYDTGTNDFLLAGSGFTFGGQFEAGTHGKPNVNGTWTGPGGSGDKGDFICYQGAAASVKAYCGAYHSTASPDSGRFSFAVVDSILAGVSHPAADTTGTAGLYFEGKVTGSSNPRVITINYTASGAYTLFAPGTLDTLSGVVGGTYTFTDIAGGGSGDDAGTYSGVVCP